MSEQADCYFCGRERTCERCRAKKAEPIEVTYQPGQVTTPHWVGPTGTYSNVTTPTWVGGHQCRDCGEVTDQIAQHMVNRHGWHRFQLADWSASAGGRDRVRNQQPSQQEPSPKGQAEPSKGEETPPGGTCLDCQVLVEPMAAWSCLGRFPLCSICFLARYTKVWQAAQRGGSEDSE